MEWVRTDTRIPIKSWCPEVEPRALHQAEDAATLSVTWKHVALMPDCHEGYGIPIGGVMACVDAVVPYAVGVDIGCGMLAARTDFPASNADPPSLREIMGEVRTRVPLGFEHHGSPQAWEGWEAAPVQSPPVRRELESARRQLGTLGGGNHFIEIQAGNDGFLWFMVHSGSRHLGLEIAEHYHRVAMELCMKRHVEVPSKDLAWFPEEVAEANGYLPAMNFALAFARRNREMMMERLGESAARVLGCRIVDTINIHHNYCAMEEHFGRKVMVHRKGATSARKDERGVIPGSMGTASYIVKGLGNEESFESCSHGAGRRMGRNDANRRLNIEDCDKAMHGIVFGRWSRDRKGRPDLSEAPQAYKDIDQVMASQKDLVSVLTVLKPLAVIKG